MRGHDSPRRVNPSSEHGGRDISACHILGAEPEQLSLSEEKRDSFLPAGDVTRTSSSCPDRGFSSRPSHDPSYLTLPRRPADDMTRRRGQGSATSTWSVSAAASRVCIPSFFAPPFSPALRRYLHLPCCSWPWARHRRLPDVVPLRHCRTASAAAQSPGPPVASLPCINASLALVSFLSFPQGRRSFLTMVDFFPCRGLTARGWLACHWGTKLCRCHG